MILARMIARLASNNHQALRTPPRSVPASKLPLCRYPPNTNALGPRNAFDPAAPCPHPEGLNNPERHGLRQHLVIFGQALSPDNSQSKLARVQRAFLGEGVHADFGGFAPSQDAVQVHICRQIGGFTCSLK